MCFHMSASVASKPQVLVCPTPTISRNYQGTFCSVLDSFKLLPELTLFQLCVLGIVSGQRQHFYNGIHGTVYTHIMAYGSTP